MGKESMNKSYVVINGKKYILTSGNDVIKSNTNEEINDFLYGEKSIHAIYTCRIKELDKILKDTKYSAGRPKKDKRK